MSRLLAAIVVAALAAVAPAAAPAAPLAPETLTLRLPDLGSNYELGSSRCGNRSLVEERWWPSTLPDQSERYPHHGCVIAFGKSWTERGAPRQPDYVMSAAFVFADAAGATAALRRPRAVAARILDADRRSDFELLTVTPAIGEEQRALRLAGYPHPGTVLLWRSGPVLALTLAAGPASDHTTRAALRLATAQQARIATPTPLLPSDLDDVEVPLDDPDLDVPVRWLGRTFPASGGRPALSLLAVDGPNDHSARGLEPWAALGYGSARPRVYVNISLWRPREMRRRLQLAPTSGPFCHRRFDAHVPGLDATLLGGYQPLYAGCENHRPEVWTAIAFYDRVAVMLDANGCYPCQARPRPYDSPAGLRTLLRSLRTREPRALATP